jgi:hypothetical protein
MIDNTICFKYGTLNYMDFEKLQDSYYCNFNQNNKSLNELSVLALDKKVDTIYSKTEFLNLMSLKKIFLFKHVTNVSVHIYSCNGYGRYLNCNIKPNCVMPFLSFYGVYKNIFTGKITKFMFEPIPMIAVANAIGYMFCSSSYTVDEYEDNSMYKEIIDFLYHLENISYDSLFHALQTI